MTPSNFVGATQLLGRPDTMTDEECGALPVARAITPDGFVCVVSAWRPSPQELEELNRGGRVYLHVLGPSMPPVIVGTEIHAKLLGGN